MDKLVVVRIEKDGIGIFRTETREHIKSGVTQGVWNRHGSFPTPRLDGIDIDLNNEEWFFAYQSIDQLKGWVMEEELKYFISKGFKVLSLEVGEYQKGLKQVAFTREGIISVQDITTLFI